MKKYVLGALFILGTMASAANLSVVGPTGTATSDLTVEVSGKVLADSQKSLVVDIINGGSTSGSGFSFGNLEMFVGDTVNKQGKFTAQIKTGNTVEAFVNVPTVKLVQNGAEVTGPATTTTANKTAIVYKTSGGANTAKTLYTGILDVAITAGEVTESFVDNTIALRIDVTGQTTPAVTK